MPCAHELARLSKTREKPQYGLAEGKKSFSQFIPILFSFPVRHPPFPLPPETLLYFSCACSRHTGITAELCFNLIQFGSRARSECTNIHCTWSTVASCGLTENF